MSIWVNSETKVVVQGITGKEGRFHSEKCREYGTKIVAGVTPGKRAAAPSVAGRAAARRCRASLDRLGTCP